MPSQDPSTTLLTQEELQEDLQISVAAAQEWPAELLFTGLVGHENESLDLFSFVTNGMERTLSQFNPDHWPPNKEGQKKLLEHLQQLAMKHGTHFHLNSHAGTLRCSRTRKARATHTAKDTTGDKLCNCRLHLKISKNKEFIYLSCKGEKMHKHHPRPGALPAWANNLTDKQRHHLLVLAQQRAAVANPQSRKIMLELKLGYISKLAYRTVLVTAPDYIAAKAVAGANSSAAQFISWLRAQAGNPKSKLSYVVLSYALTTKNCNIVRDHIGNPKGRRSKSFPSPDPEMVMNNLAYIDKVVLPAPHADKHNSKPTPPIGEGGLVAKSNLRKAAIARLAKPRWEKYAAKFDAEYHLKNAEAIRLEKEAIFCRPAKEVDNETITNNLTYTSSVAVLSNDASEKKFSSGDDGSVMMLDEPDKVQALDVSDDSDLESTSDNEGSHVGGGCKKDDTGTKGGCKQKQAPLPMGLFFIPLVASVGI
ncbi:unnamed protein product [Cylindrotheca closterium]|uniref:Uncharacterized protein n=1 Tax=Cylindrotheca closterium TaxID=2856 RepID=A0AAD2CGQ0_9STRA|nr:unnamed protein product [Cylindrotheca closterium]